MNMLIAKNICKSYSNIPILKDISINIEKGKISALVGASGVGKSTLLHILGTLEKADTGNVLLSIDSNEDTAIDYNKCDDKKISLIRGKYIGFVFQFHHLLSEFTALENIMIPGLILGEKDATAVEKRALFLMETFKIEHIKKQKPTEMSGGEQQRAAIARALINDPQIVFADEPTGNLDSVASRNVMKLIQQTNVELGTTFLIATHNSEIAESSDRIIKMIDGKVASLTG